MNNAEKKLFLSKLKSETDEQLLKTLDFFRNNGDTDVLADVLRLLESERSQQVYECVLNLVSDLKNQAASDIAFEYMTQTTDMDTQKKIISALWQSEADFSHKAEDITNIFTSTNDFETAFEILTLMENNACNITKDTANTLLYNISSKKESAAAGFEGIYDAAIQHLYNIVNGKKEID
ncbi:MAG: hypothetical protein IKQ70_02440 [Bacteroidales bacterium]|nr:hypothetical protein [Bacteroidales bacterium]